MKYFDTSFLAPLILEESTSSRVEQFMAGLALGELAISHWTRVEFASLLARIVRMGRIERRAAQGAIGQFESVVAQSFIVLTPSASDFGLAKEYLENFESGLRAGDALHLAIAKNNSAET